jgi:hypothetical protein
VGVRSHIVAAARGLLTRRVSASHSPEDAISEEPVTPRPEAYRYTAFISYSRAVDGKLAPALQSSLQRFAKPWYRMRTLRVFRDDASLSANPSLWSSIQEALDESEFFILLASPEAATSKWVCREVRYWKKHKAHDRFLIVLTDGKLVWDGARREFDWKQSAVPPTVRGVFRDEPRYSNLCWARKEEHLSLSGPSLPERRRGHRSDSPQPAEGRARR